MDWQYLILGIVTIIMAGAYAYYYFKPLIDKRRAINERLIHIKLRCGQCERSIKTVTLFGHLPGNLICPNCGEQIELKQADLAMSPV